MPSLNLLSNSVIGRLVPMTRLFSLVPLLALLLLAGCPDRSTSEVKQLEGEMSEAQLQELANRPLRVLCVGSDAWSDEMMSQYTGRYDNKIEIVTEDVDAYRERLDNSFEFDGFDVLIVPTFSLPVLAHDRMLFEIRPENLQRLNENSMLSIDRRLVRFGKSTYGISLGTPLRCVFLNQTQKQPNWSESFSWAQWHEEAVKANAEALQYIEPMAGLGPAEALLLRGGSYARSRTQVSMYFDKGSTAARINSEPFVAALTELREEYGRQFEQLRSLTAIDAIERVQRSEASAAISPIVNLATVANKEPATSKSWSVESLPFSGRFFNTFTQQWVDRDDAFSNSFQLIGTSGRVACILNKSRKTESALRFLTILSNSPTAEAIAPFGTDVGPSKAQQLDQMSIWFGKEYPPEALSKFRSLYELANDSQGSGVLYFPSTGSHFQRMEILNAAVLDAISGNREPQAALDECATKWDNLSNKDLVRTKRLLSGQ